LGRDQISPVKVTGEIPVSVPLGTPDFAGLAQQTPNHRQSRAELAQSTAAVTLARASFFPTLSMSGNLGRQGEGWFPQAERWSLGLELSYPLFSGGRDRAAAYAAASRRLASEAKSQQADRAQVSQLQESYFAWLEAIERVKVEMSFYQAAKLRSEIARNKYNNGLLSFEDWDVIESDLISRQRENLLSLRNRVVAEAAWEQAQGKGVIH
jgi:outer membrane protein TolC